MQIREIYLRPTKYDTNDPFFLHTTSKGKGKPGGGGGGKPPIAVILSIIADRLLNFEYTLSLNNDMNSYLESVSSMNIDKILHVESLLNFTNDSQLVTEFLESLLSNLTKVIEYLNLNNSDDELNTEWIAPISNDGVLSFEGLLKMADVELLSVIEYLESLANEDFFNIEFKGNPEFDKVINIEYYQILLTINAATWILNDRTSTYILPVIELGD